MSSLRAWLLGVALLCGLFALRADSAPSLDVQVPKNDGWVTDLAGMIPDADERALEAELDAWKRKTGHEIAVLTVPTLGGESLERYALEVGREWALGSKERNDAAILLVAKQERAIRIEVGRGLEGVLTDLASGRIIREVIAPQFKRGNFAGGIKAGVETMRQLADGEPGALPPPRERQDKLIGLLVMGAFVCVMVLAIVASKRASRHGGRRSRRGPGGFGGFGGLGGLGGFGGFGGGRSSGGGGFSGFGGGGGFSGGGASGGW